MNEWRVHAPDLRLLRLRWKVREEGLSSIFSQIADGCGLLVVEEMLVFLTPCPSYHLPFSQRVKCSPMSGMPGVSEKRGLEKFGSGLPWQSSG